MTSTLIRLMRPHQWIKNGFLFIGVVFGHGWSDAGLVAEALVLFAAFCLASSAVYILNDIADRDADRLHPHKRERPLARGEIGVGAPIALCIALALVGLALAAAVSLSALLIAAAYVVLNIGYSAGLKHVAILDVFMIAAGFMLRILADAHAVSRLLQAAGRAARGDRPREFRRTPYRPRRLQHVPAGLPDRGQRRLRRARLRAVHR